MIRSFNILAKVFFSFSLLLTSLAFGGSANYPGGNPARISYDACAGTVNISTPGIGFYYTCYGSNDRYNLQYARLYYQDLNNNWIRFYSIWADNQGDISAYATSSNAYHYVGNYSNPNVATGCGTGSTKLGDGGYSSGYYVVEESVGVDKGYNFLSTATNNGTTCFFTDAYNNYGSNCGNDGFDQSFYYHFAGLPPEIMASGSVNIKVEGAWWGDGTDGCSCSNGFSQTATLTIPTINGPTSLSASTDLCGKVNLTWANPTQTFVAANSCVASNMNYNTIIYRGLSSSNMVAIAQVNGDSTSYFDNTVQPNTTYVYKAQTIWWNNTGGTYIASKLSAQTSGNPKPSPPQPTGFSASNNLCNNSIQLNWTYNYDSPKVFDIQRSTSLNGTYTLLDTVSANESSFIDTINVQRGVRYYYIINSKDGCGSLSNNSRANGISPADPALPDNLTATVDAIHNQVTLNWKDHATNATQYIVERRDDQGNQTTFNLGQYDSTYTDNTLASCRLYTYDIRVISGCTPSGLKSVSTVSVTLPPPSLDSTFTNSKFLSASKGYFNNRVELSWSNNNNNVLRQLHVFRKPLGSSIAPQEITSLTPGTAFYVDNTGDAGVFYQYYIVGEAICNNNSLYSDTTTDVGFRSPTAIINGQITYAGGIAVKGVEVNIEQASGSNGLSAQFAGNNAVIVPSNLQLSPSNSISLEAWVKFSTLSNTDQVLFAKANAYSLFYQGSTGNLVMRVVNGGTNYDAVKMAAPSISANSFYQIAGVYDGKSVKLFFNGEMVDSIQGPNAINSNNNSLYLGASSTLATGLVGQMKEVRVWNQPRRNTDVLLGYNRIMNGNESGLVLLYHTNENAGTYLYDISQTGTTFNKNDGQFSSAPNWSTSIPSASQLGYIAYTDSTGSYTIDGILYNGNGENFKVIPSFGVHAFNPANQVLYLGDGSAIQNGINFTDKSAFSVKGSLNYDPAKFKSCTCPVAGAILNIDGSPVIAGGAPVETDVNGQFNVQVPIGQHVLTVSQNGHTYSAGRFPVTGLWDFQDSLTGLTFLDTTSVKVVGRVVGGLREGTKPMVLGVSKNNIGVATIIFHTQNKCYTDTIYTVDSTGDYVAKLPPMKYTIDNLSIKSNPAALSWTDFQNNPLLDISTIPPVQEKVDSIFNYVNVQSKVFAKLDTVVNNGITTVDSTFNNVTVLKKVLVSVDSTSYQKILTWTHRESPAIWVKDYKFRDFYKYGGDSTFTFIDPKGNSSTFNITSTTFKYPVFSQNINYKAYIGAEEVYTNYDKKTVVDSVPVTKGVFTINNAISQDGGPISIAQDSSAGSSVLSAYVSLNKDSAYITYNFQGGNPNIIYNPGQDNFLQQMHIEFQSGTSPVYWMPGSGGTSYTAILLGGQSSDGQGFVSSGPSVVEFVLRDPPGSNSFATLEQGSSITNTTSWENEGDIDIDMNKRIALGTEFSAGLGLETPTKIENSLNLNAKIETSIGSENEAEQTITTTSGWKTDDMPNHVGAMADVYIGRAMNLNFGLSNEVAIVPSYMIRNKAGVDSSEFGVVKVGSTDTSRFTVIMRKSLAVLPIGYATSFMYTQDYIVNTLIPNLTTLRNQLFSNEPLKYISKLPLSDARYGTNNDDPIWGNNVSSSNPFTTVPSDTAGMSYIFHKGNKPTVINVQSTTGNVATDTVTSFMTDSVRWYNQQIRLWKEAVANNERDKYLAYHDPSNLVQNYSISDGVEFENSVETEVVSTNKTTFELAISATVALKAGATIGGTGVDIDQGITIGYTHGSSSTNSTKNSTKWGYTLADNGVGDYLSTDVRKGYQGWGPIFNLTGGQTRCPYEPADSSVFYKDSITHKLVAFGVSTLQTENPLVKVDGNLKFSEKDNVPATGQAIFDLEIANNTQSVPPLPVSYAITVLTQTNPNGAILTIDGLSPSAQLYTVAGGTSIHQQLILTKGATQFNYDSIAVVVHSSCDPETIADTVYISAHFLPACTDVTLTSPLNQWVVNNTFKDTLNVVISGYDINYSGLQSIGFEYKPSAQATWVPLQSWYKGLHGSDTLDISTSNSYIAYPWSLVQLPDNNYDIRATATCIAKVGALSVPVTSQSTVFSGVVDRINPAPFGTPSPTTGILQPGQDISITFNKTIDGGVLSDYNFDIRGVLNGGAIQHSTSLFFNGTTAYANVDGGANLQNRDWTFEFWAKRSQAGQQTILSQGADSTQSLWVGFTSSNALQVNFGQHTIFGDRANCPIDNQWHHYAVAFVDSTQNMSLYADFFNNGTSPMNSTSFIKSHYAGAGKLYFGKDFARGGNFFNGNLDELRLWNSALAGADIASNANTVLGPNTGNLLYDWRMDEAAGNVATDYIRSRNATLNNTLWQINPNGYAAQFDGTSGVIEVQSAKLAINKEMDFTLEFWFNSNQSGPASLFSNGKGDGLGADSSYAWNVMSDANGIIHVLHNKLDFAATTKNYFDGNWHHFALVLQRSSSLSAYIDGNPENSMVASAFGQLGGAHMFLGARGYQVGSTVQTDNYFKGSLDEFRFWNDARLIQQITRDKQQRLLGSEPGLSLYLPFEAYQSVLGVPQLTAAIQDFSYDSLATSTVGGVLTTSVTPTIKLPRPVQEVTYNYSLNNDVIILTPTLSPAEIENVTLDITVKGVQDLHGNYMQSPKTWIAYMNQNQVVWQDASVSLNKVLNANLSFTGTIVNSGGAIKAYTIANLPSWLTVDKPTGNISPNSTLTVNFTIDPSVNIGNYIQDITLTTDFNFPEKYTLNLNVYAQPPAWSVDPTKYQYSEGIVGQIRYDGVTSTNSGDLVAAFSKGACVGVAPLVYYPAYDKYFTALDVYSNSNQGDTITFKLWSAAEGKEFVKVLPTQLIFSADSVLGTFTNPKFFDASDLLARTIPLTKGWNWFSANVLSPDSNNLNQFLSSLSATDGERLKGQTSYSDYSAQYGWTGTLAAPTAGIKVETSYRIQSPKADTLVFSGAQIDPTTRPITLLPGWNWLGFISLRNLPINQALANYNATANDVIKGQTSFAVYDSILGWSGSLTYMLPNAGYMLRSAKGGAFTYPIQGISGAKVRTFASVTPTWSVQAGNYQNNMNLVATLGCDGSVNSNLVLGAFSNGVCRGVSAISTNPNSNGIFFLTIFSDSATEPITFKLMDEKTGKVYPVLTTISFVSNSVKGSLRMPLVLNLSATDNATVCQTNAVVVAGINQLSIDPSPFTDQFKVVTQIDYTGMLGYKIYTILGQLVQEGSIENVAGVENTTLFNVAKLNLSAGMYLFELSTPTGHFNKIIVKE